MSNNTIFVVEVGFGCQVDFHQATPTSIKLNGPDLPIN